MIGYGFLDPITGDIGRYSKKNSQRIKEAYDRKAGHCMTFYDPTAHYDDSDNGMHVMKKIHFHMIDLKTCEITASGSDHKYILMKLDLNRWVKAVDIRGFFAFQRDNRVIIRYDPHVNFDINAAYETNGLIGTIDVDPGESEAIHHIDFLARTVTNTVTHEQYKLLFVRE